MIYPKSKPKKYVEKRGESFASYTKKVIGRNAMVIGI